MFGEFLAFPEASRHAWLFGLPMFVCTSDFRSTWNSEVVWCTCVISSRQPAILAVKPVTSWVYTGLYAVDFHIFLEHL